MTKEGVLGLIIGIVGLGSIIWFNNNQRQKAASEAGDEICSCLENNLEDDISSNVQRTVCLKLLDDYESLSISLLTEAVAKRCPDLANTIEIVEE